MTDRQADAPATDTRSERTEPATTVAVSSWSWHAAYYAGTWSLLDLPKAAATTGINAIECNDFMLPPPRFSRVRRPLLALLPGVPPELWRYSRATLRRLSALAAASQVSILTWAINSDFAVPTHHWPAQQLYVRRGLAAARRLHAPLLRVTLGGTPETPLARDNDVVHRLADFVARSQRDYPGVTVTVENHWGLSTDVDRHLHLIDAVADCLPPSLQGKFGCCFDPGNMPDTPRRPHWWREVAKRANHFHLKTTTFATGDDHSLPHASIFTLLHETSYRGAITIEFAGEGDAVAGVKQSACLLRTHGLC